MWPARAVFASTTVVLLLQGLPIALAHGHNEGGVETTAMTGHGSSHELGASNDTMIMKHTMPHAQSYFSFTEHAGLMYAHIALMVLSWVLILPIAVMLSIGKSRLAAPTQFAFLAVNALGVLFSIIYDRATPDLYENNSHHKAGWAITWIAGIWVVLSMVHAHTHRGKSAQGYRPITSENMAEHHRVHKHSAPRSPTRWSRDSGQGTERNTESLFSNSRTNSWHSDDLDMQRPYADDDDDDMDAAEDEKRSLFSNTRANRFLTRHLPALKLPPHASAALTIPTVILQRSMLLLGFVGFLTGFAIYGGIGRMTTRTTFNVLAHFIKGGIFFWYGLLTFSRWLGCFADFGWAWNIKPGADVVGKAAARIPTAEFTESFVIFLYGASNVFLEHVAAWGSAWTPMDLEHVSITIMFFGGGLLGMLIESGRIRRLLNSSVRPPGARATALHPDSKWRRPDSGAHSLNPLPALVILLLGIMMSAHHQHSAVSSQLHGQWGTLFTAFAFARAVTYVTLWLKPPQSYVPSRPPSEVVASFCLVAGGIVFMASNGDSVLALESYGLDAMFVFTVVMGLTSLLLAWELVVVAVKAWAVERARRRAQLPSTELA